MSTHGLGSLRKISTGTWELTFYHDNKRRYATVHASTKREAWKLAVTKKESLLKEIIEAETRKQERQLGDLWIEYIDDASAHLSTVTVKGYKSAWNTAHPTASKRCYA